MQFRLEHPRPCLAQSLIGGFRGALAREVVEAYADSIMQHPVGTGPFKLGSWRRSSLIVLERNLHFRDISYDAEPAADDVAGQAVLSRLKGRKLPMVDRVEISIIEAAQPRWLTFLGGKIDQLELPPEFIPLAVPNGQLAPYLEQRGVAARVVLSQFVSYVYFNMTDPAAEATRQKRSPCVARSAWGWTWHVRSGSCAEDRRSLRNHRSRQTSAATMDRFVAKAANSIARKRKRFSTFTGMSTEMATAGASGRTAAR